MLQDAIAAAAHALLKGPLDHHLAIEGADSEHALYSAGGSLVSLFEWHGARKMAGEPEMSDQADRLRGALAAWLAHPGHALQVVFCRDPAMATAGINEAIAPAELQARALSLDLDDIISDRRDRLARGGVWERTLLAIYTHPSAIATSGERPSRKQVIAEMVGLPPMRDAQVPTKASEELRLVHGALIESLATDFDRAGQALSLLPAAEAAQMIAWAISPAEGDVGYTPRLPGGNGGGRIRRAPHTRAALEGRDMSCSGLERLSWQLLRSHAELDKSVVRIGNTIAQGFDLALAPETLVPFRQLLEQVADTEQHVRWRASFLIESAGMHGTALKRAITSTLTFMNRVHNSRIRDAFAELQQLDGAEETVVRLRVCFACWDEVGQEARLRRAITRLRHAVDRWGNCRSDELTGDPVACLFGSLPGAGCAPTAPAAVAPLTDALCLLPLDRPASPWRSGPMTFVSPDGRFWPWQPGSALQDSWTNLISGHPGSGKSVLLNAMNAATLLSGRGRDEPLPMISIVDIGASSAGLVEMIRNALPPDQRHLAASARLQNSGEWAINPFDTPIGCRCPTILGKTFLVNFLRLMMAGASGGEDLAGLIGLAVDEAYLDAADDRRPRQWHPDQLPEVDRALEESGWQPDPSSTWWEAVDHLSDAGLWTEAALAQRLAVPLLSDLTSAAASPRLADIYSEMGIGSTGERAIAAFQRVLTEAGAEWPILSRPTVFAMTTARLRVIDLQDVTSRSQEESAVRRSALMYLLARHVCTDGYYLAADEIPALAMKARLRPSQRQRLEALARISGQTPKRLCIDEFHRAGGLPGIVDQVETDIREGRKHGVQLALASQLLTDFSERIASLATGIWICSAPPEDIQMASELLKLDESARYALRHRLTGPGPDGAPVFAALDVKGGEVRQLLMHRLGAAEIWAYSTTAEDVALRAELSRLIGPVAARTRLAAEWPGGSARRTIQRLRDAAAADGRSGEVIAGLAARLASSAGVEAGNG